MTYLLANFSSPVEMLVYASLVTGGWFWPLMLVALWIVSMGILGGFTTIERSFAATSFFIGILATFIFAMGGMDASFAVIFIALAIGGFVMLLFSRD